MNEINDSLKKAAEKFSEHENLKYREYDIRYMFQIAPENKINWWGDGEWVIEPDQVIFVYRGYSCEILRINVYDGLLPNQNIAVFGGHFCGYVDIPKGDHIYGNDEKIESIDVHGGITFNHIKDEVNRIGFDCAHCFDVLPSMDMLYAVYELNLKNENETYRKKYRKYQIKGTYRNIEFCIQECIKMVDQILELNKKCCDGK